MLFPESDRVVYSKTPLLQVICQLRFPPILDIGASDPAQYQNLVRQDFPLYEKRAAVSQHAASVFQKMSMPLPASATIHVFKSDDGHREINLSNETLAIADTRYARWEDFAAFMSMARDAFENTYHPSYYSRLGLRYINMVYRQDLGLEESAWSDLINPVLAGMLTDKALESNIEETTTVTLLRISNDTLARIQHGLAREASRPDDTGFLLDADVHSTNKEGGPNVAVKLADFNRTARRFFRWAVSERLHHALEPAELEHYAG